MRAALGGSLVLVAALAVGGCKDEPTPPSFATIPLRLGDGGFVRPDLGDAGRAHVIVDPLDPESLYLAAQEAFIAGEFEKAAELHKKALRIKPSARGWHALGDALMTQGRFAEATDAFEEAVTLEPTKRSSWMRRGRCLLNAGRPAEAAEVFHEAWALKPDEAAPLREEADALLEAKKDAVAIERLKQVLELDPKDAARDWKLIGQSFARREVWPEAVVALARSAELHPDPGIYGELGEAQVRAGALAEARASFEKAQQLDPNDPLAPETIAEIKLREGDLLGARASFEHSLRVKERAYPHLALGRLELKEGRKDAAKARLDQALASSKADDVTELREIATFAMEAGAFAAAEKLLSVLAAEDGAHQEPGLFLELARARQALKNAKGVKEACDRFRARSPKDPAACPGRQPSVGSR